MSESKVREMTGNTEPKFIRDVQAEPDMAITFPREGHEEMLEKLFAGLHVCCDICGARFPMWPAAEYADHMITQHASEITIQQTRGMGMLTEPGFFGPAHSQWVQMHLLGKVAVRRRAFELNLWTKQSSALPAERRIVEPN